MRFHIRTIISAAVAAVMLTSCSTQESVTLDVRPGDVAGAQRIALATVAAKAGMGMTLLQGTRGELVDVLTKFETELVNALTNAGYTVVPPTQSFQTFNRGLDYEENYLRRSPEFASRYQGEGSYLVAARALRSKFSPNRFKPNQNIMSQTYQSGYDNNSPLSNTEWLGDMRAPPMLTSVNTRLFGEFKTQDGVMNLPRFTENGGALDERFTSNAMRGAIGDLTKQAGADAYLLIEGDLFLSAREEGVALWSFTGGTRFVTFDGTAQLVGADGRILAVERLRGQSARPYGGKDKEINVSSDRGKGPFGIYETPAAESLREGAYQAVRSAALGLAEKYAFYRTEVASQ